MPIVPLGPTAATLPRRHRYHGSPIPRPRPPRRGRDPGPPAPPPRRRRLRRLGRLDCRCRCRRRGRSAAQQDTRGGTRGADLDVSRTLKVSAAATTLRDLVAASRDHLAAHNVAAIFRRKNGGNGTGGRLPSRSRLATGLFFFFFFYLAHSTGRCARQRFIDLLLSDPRRWSRSSLPRSRAHLARGWPRATSQTRRGERGLCPRLCGGMYCQEREKKRTGLARRHGDNENAHSRTVGSLSSVLKRRCRCRVRYYSRKQYIYIYIFCAPG